MPGSNLPDDTWPGDPRAPWNEEPPMIEQKAMEVVIGVEIEVPKYADRDRDRREIRKAIDRGDYQLLDHETAELIDTWRP
jgi:hypothetical protein